MMAAVADVGTLAGFTNFKAASLLLESVQSTATRSLSRQSTQLVHATAVGGDLKSDLSTRRDAITLPLQQTI
jgi:hypothetical protein